MPGAARTGAAPPGRRGRALRGSMGPETGRRRTGATPPGSRPSRPPRPPRAPNKASRTTRRRTRLRAPGAREQGFAHPAPANRASRRRLAGGAAHGRLVAWPRCRPCSPEPPAVQTARWLLRPIAFMESCRRRLGDPFGVKLLGFESPLYMVSDPEAIRALYTGRGHGLPPGPQRGAAADGRRPLPAAARGPRPPRAPAPDAAAVPRRAHARVRVDHARRRRSPSSSAGRPARAFPLHPSMQAITLEVILRAVFGVTDDDRRSPARGAPARAARRHVVTHAAVRRPALAADREGGSARAGARRARRDRRAALRGDRRAPARSGRRRPRRHPLDARRRAVRGRRAG